MSTITVINKETKKEILIKANRFNEDLHEKIGEAPKAPTLSKTPVETPKASDNKDKEGDKREDVEEELSEKELEDIALLAKLQAKYVKKFKKELPPRYKNDIEWIKNKLNS